jgi:DNA (cytosine-5)-methyltransferase 1
MNTYTTSKFVSELFNISCVSHERKTQMSSKSHHIAFIDILFRNGFSKLTIDTKKIREILKSLNKSINKPDGLYYIEEPFGTQSSPDFILLNISRNSIQNFLKFELKTGNKKIMWNDGYPRNDYIYLYTDNKLGKSIVCLSDYLINDDIQKLLDKYLRIIKKINTEIKSELSNCSEDYGFNIYVRKANSQSIDISKHSEIDLINFKKNICIKINKFINIKYTTYNIPTTLSSMPQKKGISLFSGAGGDTIGMTNAGIDVIGFVEFDDDAIQTHLLNHPDSTLIGNDICNITDEKFQEYKGIDVIFGGFPCFIEGTKVLTNNGYINIEDVKSDSLLLSHTGKFQSIVNKQLKQYTGDLYSIRAKYHSNAIKCTEEHPFYCRNQIKTWDSIDNKYNYTYSDPCWINANKLSDNTYLGMVINNNSIIPSFKCDISINQSRVISETITLTEKDQWFMMGYFIGDGWIEETKRTDGRLTNKIRFAINKSDENKVINRITNVIPITDKQCDSGGCKKFGCSNVQWFNILKQFGKYAYGKLIPEWVHDAPKELIQEFINGYIMADGCLYKKKNYYSITTVSENLAYGIQRLYLKLNHIVSISKFIRPKTCVIQGRTVNQRDTYQIKIYINKKRNVASFIENNYVWYKPFKIYHVTVSNISVYNFEVENDNSYCVENLIVHNCQSFSHGGKKNPNDPRGQLYKEFVRATRLIKPKFILGENVKGILTRKNSDGNLFTNDIIKDFGDIGYSMIHKLIKCEKFGVPQNRKRVFFIGINNELLQEQKLDINEILTNLPESNHETNTIRSICEFSLVNALKVETLKFLNIIPDDKVIEAKSDSDDNVANISGTIATNLLKCYEERSNHGLSFGSRSKSTFSGIEDLDKQTHTILCAYNRMPRLFIPMKNSNGVFLRPFNINELKQIQGFPVNYQFSGTDSSIIKQIGNAVPPVVVKEIITYLYALL